MPDKLAKEAALQRAIDTILAYEGAPPPIGNLTPQAVVDDIGFLKDLQKAAEKTENILWQRLSSMQGGGHPVNSKGIPTPDAAEGDYYAYTVASQEREALNQGKAKAYFTEKGILEDYMSTTDVATKTVRRRPNT